MFLNFHTHSTITHQNSRSIYNVILQENTLEDRFWNNLSDISLGLHPWYINENTAAEILEFLRIGGRAENVKCIGEAGIDKLNGAELKFQEQIFIQQIRIAEALKKPVIIHCVRAFNEVIAIQKLLRPKVPLVVHGFNKKVDLAQDLVSKDFYLSFGKDLLYKTQVQEAFKTVPIDKVFFETDDDENLNIEEIYTKAADIKGIKTEELQEIIYQNFLELYI